MAIKGALNGLAKIKEKADAKQSFVGDGESPFLSFKDGDQFKVRVMQEPEAGTEYYDERRGTWVVVEEHTSPKDFRKRAVCTFDSDGSCWACVQASTVDDKEIAKKWKPRMRFYVNVVVRNTEGEDKVKILAQGFGPKNIGQQLLELAEEYKGFGGQDLKISRKGAGMNDTAYGLIPLAPKAMTKEDKERDLLDISKFIKYVPFGEQAAFYNGEDDKAGKSDWTD